MLFWPGSKVNGERLFGSYISLPYGRLYDVNLDGSKLDFSTFGATTFIRWSFRGANMKNISTDAHGEEVYGNAEFIDCDFTNADISGAEFAHLCPQNLTQTANYKLRDLSNTKISSWTHWSDPNELKREPFARHDEDFSWSVPNYDPPNLDFSSFNLENSRLPGDLRGCNFTDTQINGAIIGSDVFAEVNHRNRHCILDQLKSTQNNKLGVFTNVTFVGHNFSGMDFSYMNLTGCRFLSRSGGASLKCNFQDAIFTNAVISNCDFSGAENLTLEQIKSTWNYKVSRMKGIVLHKELQLGLSGSFGYLSLSRRF